MTYCNRSLFVCMLCLILVRVHMLFMPSVLVSRLRLGRIPG